MKGFAAFSLVLAVLVSPGAVGVRAEAWQPPPGHSQLPLRAPTMPDALPGQSPEEVTTVTDKPVAGRPWIFVSHVSTPTITVYPPKGRNTGAAVVVFPGGGYQILAIEHEGTAVCDWLASLGITGVLLKYRVPCAVVGAYRDCPMALEDAQRAVSLVRSHATEWHIDPHK